MIMRRTMSACGRAGAVLLLAAGAASAGASAAAGGGPGQAPAVFELPARLAEISGLALSPDGRLYGHNDEIAAAYEIDPATGRIVRTLSFGTGPVLGDFEGVAISGGRIHLATSGGRIVSRPLEDANGARDVAVADAGLGRVCEIEGIAPAAGPGGFLLLCKRMSKKSDAGRLRIYEWSPADGLRVAVDLDAGEAAPGVRSLRPSDLARDPRTGGLIVLDSRARVLIDLSSSGRPLGVRRLNRKAHPQPEALAALPDGRLVIGDEGAGAKGRLTVYRTSP
jgi:uncharacterized protein YjiK